MEMDLITNNSNYQTPRRRQNMNVDVKRALNTPDSKAKFVANGTVNMQSEFDAGVRGEWSTFPPLPPEYSIPLPTVPPTFEPQENKQ